MGQQCCTQAEQIQRESQLPTLVTEVTVNNICIRITSGNIIDESTDAIFVISDQQLNIQSYLVKELIKLAGRTMHQDLIAQYQKRKTIEFGDVIFAHAGELDFDYIFFAILPQCYEIDADCIYKQRLRSFQNNSSEDSIECLKRDITNSVDQKQYVQISIKKTLKLCLELGLQSLSFPIICSEAHCNQKSYSSLVMLIAVKQFIDEHHKDLRNLSLINFTIYDKEYIKPFKHGLNRLMNHGQGEIMDTPKLAAEYDYQPVTDSYENDIIMFGHTYKNRREEKVKQNFDSI